METRSVRPEGAKIALEIVQVLEFVLEDALAQRGFVCWM